MKKLIFPGIVALALFIGIKYKISTIVKERSAVKTTMASIWKEQGKPVYTTTIQRGHFEEYFKVTFIVENNHRAIIYAPFALKNYTTKMKSAKAFIDDHQFELTQVSVDTNESEYSGFIKITVKTKKTLPWTKGTKKIARIRYSVKTNKLTIPLTAIYKEKGKDFIYTVQNNQVVKNEIQIEAKNHKDASIKGNFKGGETLIISDQRDLLINEKVKAIQI